MHGVERGLVAGVGVDRGHETLVDADRVVEHLRDRREAVGGARRVGYDLVVLRELVVVHAVDDREIDAVRGSGDEHALGAGGQMQRCLVLRREDAGAFERDVDAEILPRQLRGVLERRDLDGAVADADGVALDRDLARKAAVHRVVAQQVRVGFHRTEVVDADHLDILAARLGDGAQHVTADPAEPVDPDTNGHSGTPLARRPGRADAYLFVTTRDDKSGNGEMEPQVTFFQAWSTLLPQSFPP